MAIIVEYYRTRNDGTVLNRTYSDLGVLITCDDKMYIDAVDPIDSGRKYLETDMPIPQDEEYYIAAI